MDQKKNMNIDCDKCNGIGWIVTIKDGITSAKKCDCEDNRIVNTRLQFADIPKEFKDLTINSFDTRIYKTDESKYTARIAKKKAGEYVSEYEKLSENGKGLYLYSERSGSGKTRMAISIANALIKSRDVKAKFTTTIRILEEIKATYNKDNEYTESQLLKDIIRIDVLIIDDIGVENPSPWVKEKFYSILNERLIAEKVTIFTSNCKIEDLKLGERIISRIEKMAMPVKFPEESVRSYIAKKENEELQNILMGAG